MFTSTLRGRRLVIPISLTLKRLHQQQPRPAEPPARAKRPERPVAGLFCKLVEAPVCPALPWKKPRLRGAPPAPPPLSSASLCRLRFSEPASGTRRPPSQITLHTALRRECCCRPFAGRDQPGGTVPPAGLGRRGVLNKHSTRWIRAKPGSCPRPAARGARQGSQRSGSLGPAGGIATVP